MDRQGKKMFNAEELMKEKIIMDYCTGCGLCKSVLNTTMRFDEKSGFFKPIIETEEEIQFCESVCPVNGKHLAQQKVDTWGKYIEIYEGHSSDEDIRFKGASGGITTALAVFLLETGKVDGIIQIGEGSNPFETKVYCARSKQEIVSHSASRYIDSSPLSSFLQIVSDGGKYAFIGRPCDAICLRNYLEMEPEYKKSIVCILAFFCAGVPSINASKKMSSALGIDVSNVKHIQYRGNGWPGKAEVESIDGKKSSMEYIESWNKILGRDIRKICKFCSDGVGEAADISSGDLWYLDEEKKPVFAENKGENVVFARTEVGQQIIKEAIQCGYIEADSYEAKLSELEYVQPNHAIRKKMLFARCLAMKVMRKQTPNYDFKILRKFSKERSAVENIRTFMGTIKRIREKKL